MPIKNREFTVHIINDEGKSKAQLIAEELDECLENLKQWCPSNDSFFIARRKLEEACFYFKRSMAEAPENHTSQK